MVVLERQKASIRVIIRTKDKARCLSFVTKMPRDRVMEIIEKMETPWTANGSTIKVVVADANQKNHRAKNFRVTMDHEKVAELVKNTLLKYKGVHDTRSDKYQFNLSNNRTKHCDIKTVTFQSKGGFDAVFKNVDNIIQATIEREGSKDIIFVDDAPQSGSHIWCLLDVTTKKQRCQTIKIDGYSSHELMKLIQDTAKVVE